MTRYIARLALAAGIVLAVAGASVAQADDWFPHPSGGQWTYFWSDTKYNPHGTQDQVTVKTQAATNGCGWDLQWKGEIQVPLSATSGSPVIGQADDGTMCFQDQNYGLENTDYSGSTPPINEPALCAASSASSGCGNSLGSALFNVVWASRNPVISEPLLQSTSWNGRGGGDGAVTSANRYIGLRLVKVPAFPKGVMAAAVQSDIALAGTLGDDYGSGSRTIWWVYGVGPVKVEFDHVDGSTTTVELQATNLHPLSPRPDGDYFPLRVGVHGTYEWTNNKHLRVPEIDQISVDAAANRTGRVLVKSVSGPLRAVGEYLFSSRLDGLRTTFARTSAATLLHFPRLAHDRHFFNPVDMMIFGFNPVLPAYGTPGTFWHSGNRFDMKMFGVTGSTSIVGVRRVHVRAGAFNALELRSSLRQPGHRYGSGTRLMWFAPGRGLVKLVFHHADGSTSVVQLLK